MGQDDRDPSPPTKRSRRFNTRSRTGCSSCRQRRVRCDEVRPSCSRCVDKKQPCSYEPARIPLRDLRAENQPGEQAPWAIQTRNSGSKKLPKVPKLSEGFAILVSWQITPKEPLDPFDTFPIKMPFKSKELLHYFSQTGNEFGTVPSDGADDCVLSLAHDPYALRNMLLIAGLHYAWRFGDLHSFEPTFLAHKGQSICMVNTWLIDNSEAKTVAVCAKLITTLCVTECCLGNLAAAETHLEGLVSFINSKWNGREEVTIVDSNERELIDRYLVLAYSTVNTCKACILDFISTFRQAEDFVFPTTPQAIRRFIQAWHAHAKAGMGPRLKAMRMFPLFFSSDPLGKESRRINARPILKRMEETTKLFNAKFPTGTPDSDTSDGDSPGSLWDNAKSAAFMFSLANAHVESFSEKKQRGLMSSWSGIAVASAMYLNTVLGAWNGGMPAESRLLYHMLYMLKRDLESCFTDVTKGDKEAQDLWFWKLFIGACSLTHAHHLACHQKFHDDKFHDLMATFAGNIRIWARATSTPNWLLAKQRLTNIMWPLHSRQEYLAESLWNRAMQGLDDFECP